MRIIVISDSHGATRNIDYALLAHTDAKQVFFLGDNVQNIEYIKDFHPDRVFHIVSGNCDGATVYPTTDSCTLNGKKIIFTHGHNHSVKYTTQHLLTLARQNGADILLYGHTHIANISYEDGIYLVNPGSIALSRAGRNSYAVIDITDKGIMPIIIEI